MAITDLTGYTWVGNDSLNITNNTFNINFTSNNSNYTQIKLEFLTEPPYLQNLKYGDTHIYVSGSWVDQAYKTIQITGGTDTTNATLIAWLEANGTLTAPQPSIETKNIILHPIVEGALDTNTHLYPKTTAENVEGAVQTYSAVIELSQVISQNPIEVQLTNEQFEKVSKATILNVDMSGVSGEKVTNLYNNTETEDDSKIIFKRPLQDDGTLIGDILYEDVIEIDKTTKIAEVIRRNYDKVSSIGGKSGDITLGSGLTMSGNELSTTGNMEIVNTLPTPTEAVYNEAKLYLNGNDLYYCGKTEVVEPTVSTVASLPSGRYQTSAVAIGTNAYIFGGGSRIDEILKYDTISNTCTTLSATLPSGRSGTSAVAIGTNAYIFGGYTGSRIDEILKYDTISNTCTTLSATLPSGISDTCAVAIGTNAYIFGGYTNNYVKQILKYDSVSNTCTTLSATLPIARYGTSAVAIGTNAYIFGGNTGSRIDEILKYDTISNTCTTLSATLPSGRNETSAVAIGTNAYIFGGYTGSRIDEILKYDTISNTCTTLSATLPSGRSGTSAVAIGTNAYIFGGYGASYLSSIERVAFGFTYLFNKLAIE